MLHPVDTHGFQSHAYHDASCEGLRLQPDKIRCSPGGNVICHTARYQRLASFAWTRGTGSSSWDPLHNPPEAAEEFGTKAEEASLQAENAQPDAEPSPTVLLDDDTAYGSQISINCAAQLWGPVGKIHHVQPPLESTRFSVAGMRNKPRVRRMASSDAHDNAQLIFPVTSKSGESIVPSLMLYTTWSPALNVKVRSTWKRRCAPIAARAVQSCDPHLVVETVRSFCQGRPKRPCKSQTFASRAPKCCNMLICWPRMMQKSSCVFTNMV